MFTIDPLGGTLVIGELVLTTAGSKLIALDREGVRSFVPSIYRAATNAWRAASVNTIVGPIGGGASPALVASASTGCADFLAVACQALRARRAKISFQIRQPRKSQTHLNVVVLSVSRCTQTPAYATRTSTSRLASNQAYDALIHSSTICC